MFYTFNQNNSGGNFDFDSEKGISHYVIIEADSVEDAVNKAEDIGLYFGGVESGIDCPTCGDRWYEPWYGDIFPAVYGEEVKPQEKYEPKDNFSIKWMGDAPEGFIHYKDGSIVPFWENNPISVPTLEEEDNA